MSPCGYGHGVSPCLHVDMDMECLHFHVDMDMECLHISMWIWTQSVSMSPCGYYIITHMDMGPCLHIITRVDLAPC